MRLDRLSRGFGLAAGGMAVLLAAADVLAVDQRLGIIQTPSTVNAEPVTPLRALKALLPAKVSLGKRLFFDPLLSGDGTTACSSCHSLPPIGEGFELESAGQVGEHARNVPLLYDVGQRFWFNWDGGYRSLEKLIVASLTDKMGADSEPLLDRLQANGYGGAFQELYDSPLNITQLADALSTFLNSLSAPGARFDRFLRGDHEALTELEQRGYQLFKEIGCTSCHNGVSVGGNFMEQLYIYDSVEDDSEELKDKGRYLVTGEEADRYVFRVPSLRNVTLTGPYLHDGSVETLEDAIEEMAEHQLGIELDEEQIGLIAGFLVTLSGRHQGVSP